MSVVRRITTGTLSSLEVVVSRAVVTVISTWPSPTAVMPARENVSSVSTSQRASTVRDVRQDTLEMLPSRIANVIIDLPDM